MNLKNIWIRIIISLFAGAFLVWGIYMISGIPLSDMFVLLYAAIIYFILTGIIKSKKDPS